MTIGQKYWKPTVVKNTNFSNENIEITSSENVS